MLCLSFFLSPPCQAADPGDIHDRINNAVSRGTVGAAVFGVYDRGDVAVHGYGQTRPGGSQEPDGDTLFEIGSITKVFTAILVQRLAEQGRLDWDQPIARYLKELQFGNESVEAITLRSLATHSSGLPRLPSNLSPSDSLDPYADYDHGDLTAFLRSFVPGTLTKRLRVFQSGVRPAGIHRGRCRGNGLPQCDRGIHPCATGHGPVVCGLSAANGLEHGLRIQQRSGGAGVDL